MEARKYIESDPTQDKEVNTYLKENIHKLEEIAPSNATITGVIGHKNSEVEIILKLVSPDWQSQVRKVDPNPYIAIDMAIGELTTHVFEKKDEIDWSIF